jgi:daunorubicin/doxorubicin transport system ATP-binding protein
VSATVTPEARRINAPMTSPDAVTDLLVQLRGEAIAVDELSVQKPTLDEVFLTITGRSTSAEDEEPQRELEDSLT